MYTHPSPLPPDPIGTGKGSPLPQRRAVITIGSPLPPDVDMVITRGPGERQTAAAPPA
jgi:hypothetical protein